MRKETLDVIQRISNYLTLMRLRYSDLEKLSRLNTLLTYYKNKKQVPTSECLSMKIESAEQLSTGKLTMPLKVRGIFLTEGRPLRKFYYDEELKKSVNNKINNKFPIMLDHDNLKAGKIVGTVTKIWHDPRIKGLRWKGHINSEVFARNVIDGVINEVSATIWSVSDYDNIHGLLGRDLVFKELSLCLDGREPNNSIEVDNAL